MIDTAPVDIGKAALMNCPFVSFSASLVPRAAKTILVEKPLPRKWDL